LEGLGSEAVEPLAHSRGAHSVPQHGVSPVAQPDCVARQAMP